MATVQMTVCDVCEDPSRGTRHYDVESEGRKTEADLCDEHGKPLEHLFGDPRELSPIEPAKPIRVVVKQPARKRATAKKTATRTRTSLGARTVGSLSEIEALKGKGKK